jgi:hypothetical protein
MSVALKFTVRHESGNFIAYNQLNLPELITFDNGNTITWLYDAGGNKLRKTTSQASGTGTTLAIDGVPIAPARRSIFFENKKMISPVSIFKFFQKLFGITN